MSSNSNLSVVILQYGKFEQLTLKCIESILPAQKIYNFEIIVADNCSPDNSAELLLNFVSNNKQIKTILFDTNYGFAGGMNKAAEIAAQDWLLLVNSDTIFIPSTIERIIETIKAHGDKYRVIAPLTNNAGNEQCVFVHGNGEKKIIENAKIIFKNPTNLIFEIYRVDFFSVVIKKDLWKKLNGLDMSYGKGYYEDFDFSMRAKQIGEKFIISEDIFIFHAGSQSFKQSNEQKQLIKNNKKIFLNKFPQAELTHRRDCNMEILDKYYQNIFDKSEIEIYNSRIQARINQLNFDTPKSLIKKIKYKIKLNNIKQKFNQLFSK